MVCGIVMVNLSQLVSEALLLFSNPVCHVCHVWLKTGPDQVCRAHTFLEHFWAAVSQRPKARYDVCQRLAGRKEV